MTGDGECPYGEPADMTLVSAAAGDDELRREVLTSTVLARWAERCGEECAAAWYEKAGSAVGLTQ